MFKALLLEQRDRVTHAFVSDMQDTQLPDLDVSVEIEYSTLNYKDALAVTGKGPVVRAWPMIPGIDFAGRVSASRDARFSVGDPVVLNGWGVGEKHWGGMAQRSRVPGDYLIALPPSLSARQAMAIGTAGYTAMLCVQALAAAGVTPDSGDILVTGANGGVGSFAIAILSRRGYRVIASTGRLKESARLKALGAADVIDREILARPGKPLQKELWAGVVDSVGGHTLANACAGTRYGGSVAACGLAQSMDFPSSVAPFILRGVCLLGIDSVMAPIEKRKAAWARLATDLDKSKLTEITSEIPLDGVVAEGARILAGQVRGRIVVKIV